MTQDTNTTPQGQVPEAIAGALFDFAGFLTTLPKERAVTLSGAHLATPVVDLLTEWAETRGLNLDEANVKGWVAALTAAPADTNTTSGAADLPEAMRRSTAADGKTELFNLPGYPLMVRAVDFNRIHTESEMRRTALLDEMQKDALAAGQATAAQAVVPSGWNLVPTEPTQAMLDAVVTSMDDFLLGKEAEKQYREDWAAMLAAAPAQPAAQQPHRSGCTAGTDEECVQRGCGTNCPAVSPRQGVAYAALPDEVVRLAQVAIRECQYKGNDMPQDWMEAAMRACRLIAASHGQAPAVKREFTNELGNSIRITVEGPNSMHENIVTPMEAKQLREALNEHAQKSAPAAIAGPSLYQVMAVAKAIHATTPDADDWDSLRQCEVDALRGRAEKVLAALAAQPTAQPAHQPYPTAQAADSVQEDAAWMPLTPELLTAIESGDIGNRFWIAVHNNNEPQIGVYEWQQGRNPHGFNSDLSRYGASEITHVLPYKPPALPAARKKEKTMTDKPTPTDTPPPCDQELFDQGVSVGLFDIPKWAAEALCRGIAAATEARVDWHYIGGRVHIKALPAASAPADSVQEDAALWHWLAEYLVGTRTDLDDEIVASETVNDLRKLVKAAIKQAGATGECTGPRCMASSANGYAHSLECIDEAAETQGWTPTADDYAKCGPSAPQPVEREPVAWKHDCAALLTNDVELWIDACPHCGKPRNAPQPVAREPLTEKQIQDLLLCGNPTDEEMRLIRIGWDAARSIKRGQHGTK